MTRKLLFHLSTLLILSLTFVPWACGTRVCQWIKGLLLCQHPFFFHNTRINPSFVLPHEDTDPFFSEIQPHDTPLSVDYSIVCDTFSTWVGYSLSEIKRLSQQLDITEQSDWSKWNDRDTWVFLGYRGTHHPWAQQAAEKEYQINPEGVKLFGEGIYMSPQRRHALSYATDRNRFGRRICYNFAPKRMLNQLLMCSRVHRHRVSSIHRRIVRRSAPRRVSARFDEVYPHYEWMPWAVVYPKPFLPYIRVVCMEAPEDDQDIPNLFQYNHLYFNTQKKKMQLYPMMTQ